MLFNFMFLLLGIGMTWYFTTPYEKLKITPYVEPAEYGIQFNYTW